MTPRAPRRFTASLAATLFASVLLSTGCTTIVDEPATTIDEEVEEENEEVTPPTEEPAACASPSWDGEFEVGSGASCFEPVQTGDVVALIGGPQGGYHLWLGVRCRDCGSLESVTYGVRDAETGEFLYGTAQSAVLQLEEVEGYSHVGGLTAFVPGSDFDSAPGTGTDLIGREVMLYAEVNVAGYVITSEVDVTVGDLEVLRSDCPECN